ncbi:MAG: hypothetical protein ACLP50_08265 [Solirubrobacteraceae bacterium]
MENVPGLLDMHTRDGIPVIDALALMAQEGGMGTFLAIRRSLAETAGAGAALRTVQAAASRRQPQARDDDQRPCRRRRRPAAAVRGERMTATQHAQARTADGNH